MELYLLQGDKMNSRLTCTEQCVGDCKMQINKKKLAIKNMISQVSGTKQIMIPHSGTTQAVVNHFLLLHVVTKIYAINHARKQSM